VRKQIGTKGSESEAQEIYLSSYTS